MGLDLIKLDPPRANDANMPIWHVGSCNEVQLGMDRLTQTGGHDIRLDLLYEVSRKASSASEVAKVVHEIVPMTQQALRALASSVLLLDEEKQELYFDFADGEVRQNLKQIRMSIQCGIAGWVARYGRPLIVNDVNQDQRFCRDVDEITGFVTRSIMCAPLIAQGKVAGVVEVLNKLDGGDFDEQDLEVLVSVASTAAMAIENAKLHEAVIDGYKRTVRALAAAIDAKDPYTCGHSQRVKEYALLAGRRLSLPPEDLEALEYGGILHDVGKIGVLDSTLRKPSQLESHEWAIMRGHPSMGAHIIGDVPFLEQARKLVLHHHEKHDGTGYPGQLSSEHTPVGARLIAVADAFDTMTTDRAYRSALSVSYALDELRRYAGTQFCPVAVGAFISGLETYQQDLVLPGSQIVR